MAHQASKGHYVPSNTVFKISLYRV